MIRKVFTDILTGIDNSTFDHGRVLSFISFIFYYVFAFASLLEGHAWQAMDFASGVGAMAVGFGLHLKLKSDTEPMEKKNDVN
jgi:hypothetical protein